MTRRRPIPLSVPGLAVALLLGAGAPAGAQAPDSTAAPAAPTGAAAALPSAEGQRIDAVAAVVNDQLILQSEVDEQLYLFLSQSGARPDSSQLGGLRRDIIDRLIDEKIIVDEAKRQNVTVSDAELEKNVDGAIADVKERLGSEAAYQAELKREGISESDLRDRYRDEVRRQMLANALLRKQIANKNEMTPAEAEAYYKAHVADFPKRPSAIHVQLIQLPVEPDSAAKANEKKRALDTLARIRKGEPFSRLAQELSEDPGTRQSGGDLGWFKRGSLDSTFEDAAFKLKPGEVSGVVETPFGYHLIKVEETDPARGEIHARHILFSFQPTDADVQRARKRILEIRAQAVKGVDFGTLARRYSKYKGPAGPDGDLGLLPMNVFQPDFRAALDTLEVGEVSAPLLNAQGFHLFKVLDREPERAYRVDEIRDELPDMVRQAKLRDQYDTYVADLRKKAHIEYR